MAKSKKSFNPPGGILVLFLLIGCLTFLKSPSVGTAPYAGSSPGSVFVQVAGDIPCSGVLRFSGPVTLKELLLQARIYTPDIRLEGLKPATLLTSGTKVAIRKTTEGYVCKQEWMSAFYKVTLGIPIHLNSESEIGLTAVSGIGPALSAAIVLERQNRQGFRDIEELRLVPGISHRLYKKISPYFTL